MSARNSVAGTVAGPLSDTQKGFWIAEHLANAPAYNEHVVHHVRGPIDGDRLRDAEQRLVDRHEILRTTFGDEMLQYVHPSGQADFEVIDARGWGEPRTVDAMVELVHRRFDFRRQPLLRARLLLCGDEEAYLLHAFHHLVLDGFSWMLAEQELFDCYVGGASWSPPAPGRFSDFVAWQRALTDGRAGERHWHFWREELRGATRIELPTDHPRGRTRRLAASSQHLLAESELLQRVRQVAASAGSTFFGTVLAAVQVLMARRSGKTDILLAVPSSGHARAEFRRVLGPLANPLLVRAQLQPGLSFTDVARSTARKLATVLEHQVLPVGVLASRLELGGMGGVPFDVLVSMLKPRPGTQCVPLPADPGGALVRSGAVRRLADLAIERISLLEVSRAPFDVGFVITEYPDRLTAGIRWDPDLFERSTIDSLAAELRILLEEISTDPASSIRVSPTRSLGGRSSRSIDLAIPPSRPSRPSRSAPDEIEERLTRLWCVVLKRPVERTDDFFDLGGDSLLAVQLITAIADEFGIHVAPRRLFDANTVELMATVIRSASVR